MLQEPRICQVVAASTPEEARALLTRPPAGIDLMELRVDRLEPAAWRPDVVASLVASAARPVVATCRPEEERGGHPGDDAEREVLLQAALGAGARFIDLEWSWWKRDPTLRGRFPAERVLLSHHEWEATPPDIDDIFEALLREPVTAWKLVVQADDFGAALHLVTLAREAARRGHPMACFALGPVGRVTRILSALAGSWLTYVAPDSGPAPAGDLLTVTEALELYGLKTTPPDVKLLGVVGRPARRSLSPELHNRVIRRLGERYLYLPFDAPDPRPVLEFMRRGELRGLSVTIPHKQAVLPQLDGVDVSATQVGAVNTIVRRGGRLIGFNTDLTAAREIFAGWGLGAGDGAAVLGAGGAARAAVAALRECGVAVTIINRDERRGRALAREFGGEYGGPLPAALDGRPFSALVNATPLGSANEVIPGLPPLRAGLAVLDLAYRRGETPLERSARAAGARVTGGLEFLARQAAAQFTLWTGRRIPVDVYLQAVVAAVPEVAASIGFTAPPKPERRTGYAG